MVVFAWMLMPATEMPGVEEVEDVVVIDDVARVVIRAGRSERHDPLLGRLAPAGPMSLFEMVLPLFVPPVDVLIRIFPPAAALLQVDEPSTVAICNRIALAPLIRRTCSCPQSPKCSALEIVMYFQPN